MNKKITGALILGALGAAVGATSYFVYKKKEEEYLKGSIHCCSVTGLLAPLLRCDDITAMKIQRKFFIITKSDIDTVVKVYKKDELKAKVMADGNYYMIYLTDKFRVSNIELLGDDDTVICTYKC